MKKIFALVFVFIGLSVSVSQAQNEKFKALFLYNITKFIEWPSMGDNFIICSVGNPPTLNEFSTNHASKRVGGKAIVLQPDVDITNIPDCQIFFLPSSHTSSFESVLNQIKGKPILLVTDGEGLAQQGSCVNYAVNGGKLDLEISRAHLSAQGLKVNHQLMNLGTDVDAQ